MADKQPPTVVEGATTGDVEDELPTAKSAEDRKAASALASLDDIANDDAAASARNVDQDAVSKAMKTLGGGSAAARKDAKPTVKVDQADVALLVDELDLSKPKATELLKSNEGDAVKAMRAYVSA
jgi:NACalpha-BTF3-like transcription factor